MAAKTRGKPWTREELMLACNLYFTLPFGQMHSRNQSVVSLARALGRTPGSVAMKLVNFASLDPVHRARGISGLTRAAKADREVWQEFQASWDRMASETERRMRKILPDQQYAVAKRAYASEWKPIAKHATETIASVRVRTMQSFFRRAVLSAYTERCCISGNTVPELLVASHILPWADFPEERLNPRNGLCLAVHFDRAFDQGLISFADNLTLLISPRLRSFLPNNALESEFVAREGTPLRMPERFPPDPKFLEHHRRNIFRV